MASFSRPRNGGDVLHSVKLSKEGGCGLHVLHAFVTELTLTDPVFFFFFVCFFVCFMFHYSISAPPDSEFASKSCLFSGLTP